MPPISPGTAAYALADVFRRVLTEVLSQTLGSPWTIEITPDETAVDAADSLHFGLTSSGALQGNACFQLMKPDARSLGQKLLKEPADASSELNAQHKQEIETLLRKAVEQAAVALKNDYGEVDLKLTIGEAPAWAGLSAALAASGGPAGTFAMMLRLSNELVAALPAAVEVQDPPLEGAIAVDSNLDLLLGVDLSLTLRFGQRMLTLREILDLSSGSVIELDRRVQEPADLLLGDKLIARGEVVIVDSNYGLRITEVCDAQHQTATATAAGAIQ